MKRYTIILLPVVCLIWISIIFFMSSDINSNKKTEEISKKIEAKLNISDKPNVSGKSSSKSNMDKINYILRKSGHFIEYLVFGVLLYFAFCAYSFKFNQSFIYILFIVLLVANLDEFYQSFVGRTSMVADSLIDLCGGTSGAIIASLLHSFSSRVIRKLNGILGINS